MEVPFFQQGPTGFKNDAHQVLESFFGARKTKRWKMVPLQRLEDMNLLFKNGVMLTMIFQLVMLAILACFAEGFQMFF